MIAIIKDRRFSVTCRRQRGTTVDGVSPGIEGVLNSG